MTDLVAEAIARLQKEKLDTETWLANEESWTSQDDIDRARYYLRIVDCHLAEFGEHDKVYDNGGIDYEPSWSCVYDNCYETTGKNTPCDLTVTKAKRLLGRE